MKLSAIATIFLVESTFAISDPAFRKTRDAAAAGFATTFNGAGAFFQGSGYTGANGTFKVPTPTTNGSGNAYVGLDTDACSSNLKIGIHWEKSGSSVPYNGFYRWASDYEAFKFTDFPVSAGDTIMASVKSSSPTAAVAILENLTRNKHVKRDLILKDTTKALCGGYADWGLEDSASAAAGVTPFAGIGTFTITNASAIKDGKIVPLDAGGSVYNLQQDDSKIATDASISPPGLIIIKNSTISFPALNN